MKVCYYEGKEYTFIKNEGDFAIIKDSKGKRYMVSRLKVNFIIP